MAAVSLAVSFADVQHCPPATSRVRIFQVGTEADRDGQGPADLGSVLGATAREFESRILRHP